jgi:ParB family chromosome partitioning protein
MTAAEPVSNLRVLRPHEADQSSSAAHNKQPVSSKANLKDVARVEPSASAPASAPASARPVDVFFPTGKKSEKKDTWAAASAGGRIGLHPHESKPQTDSTEKPDHSDLTPVVGARFAELPVTSIRPNPQQPRTHFAEAELSELVNSISQIGVLQPIVVRETTTGYELIMGERRWRAAQAAGLLEIPAIIRSTEDTDMLRDALLENLHRANLNPLEEATAYRQLLDDFGCSQEELATRIARSRPQISNTLRLLKLPPLVQRRVAAGALSAGHARALLSLPTPEAMEKLAQRIVAEGLSVRTVEELTTKEDKPVVVSASRPAVIGLKESRALSSRLAEKFSSPVQVRMTRNGGKLAINFTDVADLNRLLALIAPEDQGVVVSRET